MKKRILLALFLMVCILFSAIVGVYGVGAQSKPIELKYAGFAPPVHPQNTQAVNWCKEVEKRTNGRVKITFFGSGTLLGGPAMYEGIISGVADIGVTVLAYTQGRFPLISGLDLPLGYPNAIVATKVANDVARKFKPKELADTHLLYLHAMGTGSILSNKPVRRMEDLKGMRIRGTGNSAKIVKALGGTPVAIPMPETYNAIFKGIVDGAINTSEVLLSFKLGEVIKYITKCPGIGYTTVSWAGMNLQKWNALPKDIQEIITEVSQEYEDIHAKTWSKMEAAGWDMAQKLNKEIIELSSEEDARWVKAVNPLIKKYLETTQAKGLPGKEFLEYTQGQITKYSK